MSIFQVCVTIVETQAAGAGEYDLKEEEREQEQGG
jgi:hypothetical protein